MPEEIMNTIPEEITRIIYERLEEGSPIAKITGVGKRPNPDIVKVEKPLKEEIITDVTYTKEQQVGMDAQPMINLDTGEQYVVYTARELNKEELAEQRMQAMEDKINAIHQHLLGVPTV